MTHKEFSKEESKEKIKRLIDQFDYDFGGKKNPQMKEAQLEDKYIKPFFSYLNWNIHNEGLEKGREEFRVQTSQKIKKTTKEPDYELWLPDKITSKMKRYLFMEAKDPRYDLQKEVKYIRQAYQYAHSTLNLSDHSFNRTRLSLLTDFEEFRLFDCFDPLPLKKNDPNLFNKYVVKPFDFNYKDYEREFNILWDAFERNNVLNGSLSEFQITDEELKKNRIAPDLRFLDDLRKWRLEFAKSMFKSNKDVTDDFLTAASQVMLNRIIFLKMLTDREIEKDYLTDILEKIKNEKEEFPIYDSCREIFEKLDKRYNGDIFKKRKEFDYVQIENKVFTQIIDSLRPEKSIYSLSAMPVEIIGNAYEQFLGEVIVHKGRGLSSEQKPEVQKAGGVYYTPRFIVDYIVENTVGVKLKACKNPNDVSKIKILDPACGSGSFLIGAYNYLLDWHNNYYKSKIDKMLKESKSEFDIKKKYRDEIKFYPITNNDEKSSYIIHLTSKLKKSILQNNIHGVDIDENAVEITRFSLSMKALEDSTREELYEDVDLFNEKVLPSLDNNIKCGNSLIEDDFYQKGLFESDDYKSIKDFNWKQEFSNIFVNGGFDCVIGNPPYLRIQGLQDNYAPQIDYYINNYKSAVKRFDFYLLFLERGFFLLNSTGVLGYINPHKFTNSDFGSGIRSHFIENKAISKIISFGNNLIFSQASTYTGLFFLNKEQKDSFQYYEMSDTPYEIIQSYLNNLNDNNFSDISYDILTEAPWILSDEISNKILTKLNKINTTAKDIFSDIMVGIQSGIDDIHILEIIEKKEKTTMCLSTMLNDKVEIENDILKSLLMGSDVKRYQKPKNVHVEIYPYTLNNGKTSIIEEKILKQKYPLCYSYLYKFKKELKDKRISQKTNPTYWYSCHRPRKIDKFETKKILTPEISLGCNMTYDECNFYHNTKVYSIIPNNNYREDIKYWLAILNSNLMWFFLKTTGYVLRGGYFTFKTKYIEPFPLPTVDFNDVPSKEKHDFIVNLVDQRINLQAEIDSCMQETEKKMINKRILSVEKQLNEAVYQLYQLEKDEIEEIEKSSVTT